MTLDKNDYLAKYEHQFDMLCTYLGHNGEWMYMSEERQKASLRELLLKAHYIAHGRAKESNDR